MRLSNPSLEYVYCSNLVSNHVIIRLIRFVSRFTVHLCNAIYFLSIFSTPCKWFTKILRSAFWEPRCMDLLRPVYGRQTYLHVEGINNLPTYGPAPIPLSQVNDLVINENELWFKHWPYGIHSSSFITVTTIWGVYKKYLNSAYLVALS